MPIYHFHVHNEFIAQDEEGVDFPNLEAAKASSIVGARFLMSNEIRLSGWLCLSYSIEITDSHGVLLDVTRFGDCVTIRP